MRSHHQSFEIDQRCAVLTFVIHPILITRVTAEGDAF